MRTLGAPSSANLQHLTVELAGRARDDGVHCIKQGKGTQMNISSARADHMHPDQYDALAAYRYRVFVERLGWELATAPGHEQDQFDHGDTVHIVASNEAGGIVGCGRLLPTTGEYLLASVFPELFNGLPIPRDEKVWELSRFAAMELEGGADGTGHAATGSTKSRTFLAERVLLEALRFCATRGVTQLLAVSTLPVERLLKRAGVDVVRLGPPMAYGGQQVLAFVIGVHARSIEALAIFEAAAAGREALRPQPAALVLKAAAPLGATASLPELSTGALPGGRYASLRASARTPEAARLAA